MSVSGITTTVVNGAHEVTTGQSPNIAAVNYEGILIHTSGAIRATDASANVTLDNTTIFINDVSSGSETNLGALSYNGNDTDRIATGKALRLNNCQVMFKTSERKNIFVTDLIGCIISEVNQTRNLFVYTQPGGTLRNTLFTGTTTWEVVGSPAEASGLSFVNVKGAFFNWEAGRLDFLRINVESFTQSSCFMGAGASNNAVWNWDKIVFNQTKVGRNLASNEYYEGISASWEFRDSLTNVAVQNVTVIYRDNRTGSVVERGRYTTNSSGRLSGTHDSRLGSTGSDVERAAVFMMTLRLVDNAATGANASFRYDGGGGRAYDLSTVTPQIEIRSYNHRTVANFSAGESYPFAAAQGAVSGLFVASTYQVFPLITDAGVTQTTIATVLAYTTIANLEQIYDRLKAEWRTTDNLPLPSFVGSSITLTQNLVLDATAVAVYAYNSGTNTITIKAATLSAATKFIKLVTTGTLTFSNGAAPSATLVYQSSAGTSVPVTASNLIAGSRVQIFDVPNTVELANVVIGSGGYVGRFIWSVDKIIRLRANFQSGVTGKLPIETTANLTNLGASFLATQDDDTIYTTNGIDGSTVTEFAADYPNIQMDITDPDGVTSVQRLYAWWRSNSATSTGVANFFKGLIAEDAINYRINTSIVNLKLDNRNIAPVIIAGGRIYRDNATTVIAALSGSIQMDPDKAYSVETGVSGLTVGESALLANITPIKNLIEADEIHTATTVQKRQRGTATVLLTKNHSGIPLNTFQAVQ